MNVDFSQLLNRANQSETIILIDQWSRFTNLFGEEKAKMFLLNLLQNHALDIVQILSDQQISAQYSFQPPTNPQIHSAHSPSKKEQKMILQNKSTQQERITRQVLQSLRQYRPFCSIKESSLYSLIQSAFRYKNKNILQISKISSAVDELKNKAPSQSNIFDFLQIVDSALYYTTNKYRLRQTQILALLLFIIAGNKRMLLEILTGQGKSTTVSCLAAILTISGLTVDIATTSQLLAERDVQEKRQFYKILGLKVAHNFEDNQRGSKMCYLQNRIVYGTPHSFQVDILLNDYRKLGTRDKRKFQVLIVDEVDCLFIDQKQHQTLLSTTFPGFYELVKPMKLIWNKICTNPIFNEKGKMMMAMHDGNNNIITGQVKAVMKEVIEDIRSNFKNSIIPPWRVQFVQESLEKWIQSAIIAAFVYKQGKQYLVKKGKIIPYDYKNNGSPQQNVQWQNGLHQFLEIKHGLQVNTEGMTSNFISNLGHFDKYKYLFGLTGTIGSNQSKEFLQQTYLTNLFKIPPFKARRLQVNPGIVLYDQIDWANYICETIQNMLVCERSVLVLCESIKQVQLIKLSLERNRIKPYRLQILSIGNQSIDDNIECGQIFLATNLAGRGADLKITERLNQMGGLHVIISFMPINSRVQMQGRGRAGRNGCNGSSQLAINYLEHCQETGLKKQPRFVFLNWGDSLIQKLVQVRDENQMIAKQQEQKNVAKLRAKDHIFSLFCIAMNQIPDYQNNHAKQKALEEQWAMFLKKIQNRQLPYEILQQQALGLINNLKRNSDGFYNPNHEVDRGINKLFNNQFGEASSHFRKAVQNSDTLPQIIGGTYLGSCLVNSDKGNKQKMQESFRCFEQTKQNISRRIEKNQAQKIYDIPNKQITNLIDEQEKKAIQNFSININPLNRIEDIQPISLDNIKRIDKKDNPHSQQINPLVIDQSIANVYLPQDRILKALYRHIQEIQSKFKNLGSDQHIQFRYQPSKQLLSHCEGDKDQNNKALQIIYDEGLKMIPIPQIKKKQKKKVPWWKRALVFCLGIAQMIVGVAIVAATGGALAGFGTTMIYEGIKDCYNAIFSPEQIADLGKYFSQKVITYAFSLALAGFKGCKQLAYLSQNGFKITKNVSIEQFLQKLGKGALQTLISKGIAYDANKDVKRNNLKQSLQNPLKRVTNNKDSIRRQVKRISQEEQKLDESSQTIINNFRQQMQAYISKYVSSIKDAIIPQMQALELSSNEMNMIISQSLRDSLGLPENNSNSMKAIEKLFARNIKQAQEKKNFKMDGLARQFTQHIQMESKIRAVLRNITANQNYPIIIKRSIGNKIIDSIEKIQKQKKIIFDAEKASINSRVDQLNRQKSTLLASQAANYNRQVDKVNQRSAKILQFAQKYNTATKDLKIDQLYETINQRSGIQRGRLKPAVISSLNIHQFIKQALLKLQYSDSSRSLQQDLQAAIFNSIGSYGQAILLKTLDLTKGSVQKISRIADMITN